MSSRQSVSTTEDRISALPDSLICHILSFLPTKLAFATSILSKRWTPLWKSVTTLDFDNTCFPDFPSFRHFVYSIIVSRDITQHLRSFCIRCGTSKNFDGRDINRFVHAAVQQRIENFELNLSNVMFPHQKYLTSGVHSIFCCSTLVVLKLGNLTVYEVPNLVDLPLLKILHLDSIYFLCHYVHFMNLLRGCPILEDLHINYLTLFDICNDSVGEFKGFPKLVRANIYDSENKFPFTWLHNAKFLCVELMLSHEYTVPTFHNLTQIELIFKSCTSKGKWKFVIQVLQHCPKLQNITLVEDIAHILPIGDKDWTEPETIPECLSSQLRKCSFFGFGGIECDLQFAEYILLNSKLLCTMTVRSNLWLDIEDKYPMLVKLSSYPRGSVTCKLLFD